MIATNSDLQEEIKQDGIKCLKTYGMPTEMDGWVRLVEEAANANSKLRHSLKLTYGKVALYAKELIAAKCKPTTSTVEEETTFIVPVAMFTEEV
eukprot:6719805-Ditylum_brightwellii.AAC.1